jgi:hypothetical protein
VPTSPKLLVCSSQQNGRTRNPAKGWFVNLKGDAGGFGAGSQLTWQVYTGVGKEFKQRYSMLLGYRYLYVDYKNGGFLFDTHMGGLLAGFAIRL